MKVNFEELYDRFFRDVYLFILAMSKDPHIAEEITQETFFKALKEYRHFRGSCSVKSWLCQIAKHIYLQYLAKRRKEMPSGDIPLEWMPGENTGGKGIEDQLIKKYELLDVLKDMQNLPEQMREVIYLRTMADLSFKEIGEILGKSENWARVTFYRGKERLLKGREGT